MRQQCSPGSSSMLPDRRLLRPHARALGTARALLHHVMWE